MYGIGHQAPFMSHGFGLLGGLFGLLVWIAVIAIVVTLIVKMARHGGTAHAGHVHTPVSPTTTMPVAGTPAEDEALRIARARLARGEIDPEQYRTIVEALSS